MEQKLGGGIITISVLTLVGFAFNLISYLAMLIMGDSLNEMYSSMGLGNIIPSTSTLVVSLILSIIIGVSTILILMKKSIGVYGYFIGEVLSIISSIIFTGFSLFGLIISLIFPVLMFIFIYKRKTVFGFSEN
ncbi:putative membrane protein [Clostridium bornimense]|uniref:Putative membrane protein n=1 Tax=Clostridium bornimense TaxID=1216932 RepID=W6RTJ3_9CLOT|nr:hypothetical protein [Clostridium bornimense]CDM67608.1 putative membrane protein [Clostridium bornimense]